jgi:cation diffusion facilitator family transporter
LGGCECELDLQSTGQARVLWILLAINGGMFIAEFGAGLLAESTALLADSLDMLADAAVYAVSLYAVARTARSRASAAMLSGYLQVGLGVFVLVEVLRRLLVGSRPEPLYMIAVSIVALAANTLCLRLIAAHREGGVHMRASYIFSQNDVIANCAVILSGLLVAWSDLAVWDLVAGGAIGSLVCWGGIRIIRDARSALSSSSSDGEPRAA